MNRKTGRAALYPVLTHEQQCYLALRAGPINSDALRARLEGDLSAVFPLIHRGHVEVIGDRARREETTTYRLTPAGRAACPSRRAVEREEVAA